MSAQAEMERREALTLPNGWHAERPDGRSQWAIFDEDGDLIVTGPPSCDRDALVAIAAAYRVGFRHGVGVGKDTLQNQLRVLLNAAPGGGA